MRIFVIRMNNTKPPFDNLNARKCFAHAFNYMGFINDILGGYATRDPDPMPDNLWGIPKDVKGYDYDLKKAKEYCAKAIAEGAPMKRPIEMHVQSENEQSVQAAQLFQSDLAQIGINLKVVGSIWSTPDDRSRQARDHARHVGPLGHHLLRRSRELGRPDVRQPVPRHLEGVGLVQESRGRRAAAQGARAGQAGGARAALRGGDPQDHGRLARHLDLQHHGAPGPQQAGQGPPLLHRRAAAREMRWMHPRRKHGLMPDQPRSAHALAIGDAPETLRHRLAMLRFVLRVAAWCPRCWACWWSPSC